MADKQRILMVHNYYAIRGGECSVFDNEVKMLREHGHEVVVYTRDNLELNESKWKKAMVPFTTVWSRKTYCDVRRIIRDQKIEIVHCHNTFPLISPSVYYAARSMKVPVLQTIHNFRLLCPNGMLFRDGKTCELCRERGNFACALKNRCYRNSRIQTLVVAAMLRAHRMLGTYRKISYIFLTDFNKEKVLSGLDVTNGNNLFVKPNFVGRMLPASKAMDSGKRFIYYGRMEANKGVRFLLECWESMPADYKLHLYGDGELKPMAEAVASRLTNVEYFGFRSRMEIAQDLAGAAAMLFLSQLYEGYPMVIAESFSLGIPVIAYDMGNQAAIIRESGGGVLMDEMNVESFKKAVDALLSQREGYSKCALAYYEMNQCEDRGYNRIKEIYDCAKHVD